MAERVGGIIRITVDGQELRAKGEFDYNLGNNKREAVLGAGYAHGYKETPQVAFIEGAITDSFNMDLSALMNATDSTVILDAANGKSIVFRNAYFAGEGGINTGEGEVKIRFESPYAAEELR